jgi:hypothetical protein
LAAVRGLAGGPRLWSNTCLIVGVNEENHLITEVVKVTVRGRGVDELAPSEGDPGINENDQCRSHHRTREEVLVKFDDRGTEGSPVPLYVYLTGHPLDHEDRGELPGGASS